MVGAGTLDAPPSPSVDHVSFGDCQLTPRDRAALAATVWTLAEMDERLKPIPEAERKRTRRE